LIFFFLIGALTSKPYAFTIRPWELQNIETVDVFDSLCSNIRVEYKNSDIIRVLPINNEFINEEWISDKTRFGYDSLKRWRFIYPMFKKNQMFYQTSWSNLFAFLKKKIKIDNYNHIIIKTGPFSDIETLISVEYLSNKNNKIILNNESNINFDLVNYFLNVKKLKKNKIYLFIGNNLRLENPLLNVQFKKLNKNKTILIAYIGVKCDINLKMFHLGTNLKVLKNILEGKHYFIKMIKNFEKDKFNITKSFKEKIWIIFGKDFVNRININNVNKFLQNCNTNNFFFTFLTESVGKINLLSLGIKNFKIFNKNKINLYYILGCENLKNFNYNDFIIFQGHHNDKIRKWSNVILPTVTWIEKSSLYFNCFGFLQKSNFIFKYPYKTRLDWKIIKMMGVIFDLNVLDLNSSFIYTRINELVPKFKNYIYNYNKSSKYIVKYIKKYSKNFYFVEEYPFNNYYPFYCFINSIERSSKTLSFVMLTLKKQSSNFY